MNVLLWPLVVALGGALSYALSSNGKVAEIGRLAFFVGLFWLVAALTHTPALRF